MPYKDPIRRREYHRAYNREWQRTHHDWIQEYQRNYKKSDEATKAARTRAWKNRQECNRIKREAKNKPCADCNVAYPFYVLQFDHVPSRGPKLFNISTYKGGQVDKLKAEIAKCDVVCANCHAERTWGRGKEV